MAEVKVYSTPTCPYCKLAKTYLTENQIAFEDIDVTTSQTLVQEMIKRTGQMGVPVIDIDGRLIIGFDRKKIAQLLGLK